MKNSAAKLFDHIYIITPYKKIKRYKTFKEELQRIRKETRQLVFNMHF